MKKHTLSKSMETPNLYDPLYEHDACGIGFVAQIKNRASHTIVTKGLKILENLEHRGAVGQDPLAGDGAGFLTQIPHKFFHNFAMKEKFTLPPAGSYAVGQLFMPRSAAIYGKVKKAVEKIIRQRGHKVLAWRTVPTDNSVLGVKPKQTEPRHVQVLIVNGGKVSGDKGSVDTVDTVEAFERELFVLRRAMERAVDALKPEAEDFYVSSLSARVLLYKGMFLACFMGRYYPDLHDSAFESSFALVHQRFSTNTFPSWRLAHPFRTLCHNGEINTLRGNVNWMAARHNMLKNSHFDKDAKLLSPIISSDIQSDSAVFDNTLEFLLRSGYSLAHAITMMVPEAWAEHAHMSKQMKDFYMHHAAMMEPWDGPAAVAFTDGRQIGAILDRNGLRPARYVVTSEDEVIFGSEVGVLPVEESKIIKKWRLEPGKIFLVDLEQGRIVEDEVVKKDLATAAPYGVWNKKAQIPLKSFTLQGNDRKKPPALAARLQGKKRDVALLRQTQKAFGYTQEDVKTLLAPMVNTGEEAIGSMGTDTPLGVLSDKPKLLYHYFKQNFAQVTNPAIDPIRERLVMSLLSFLGPRINVCDLKKPPKSPCLRLEQPILSAKGMARLHKAVGATRGLKLTQLDITYSLPKATSGKATPAKTMERALKELKDKAYKAVVAGSSIVVLSDRRMGPQRVAIPALLATGAVHHHLVRKGVRADMGLVMETGEAREVHHFSCLAGYGAEAIHPYLAFETIASSGEEFAQGISVEKRLQNYVKALGKGLCKVMSKMGISTYQSYCGSQVFDAVGLKQSFVDAYFTGTPSKVEGVALSQIAEETHQRHHRSFARDMVDENMLPVGGEYAMRQRGEAHMWDYYTVRDLQHATRGNVTEKYQQFAHRVNEENSRLMVLRSMMRLRPAKKGKAIPLSEVEPASAIVKRFSTGAMSFGSISREAHTTLAIAMNRIGGRSNTGEGGEESDRYTRLPNGDSMRSSIKQVASGRFGVTTEYLVNADVIQIKIAQGAKPGEGGQLPGHKVDATIAKVRHSTPGVGLISPPPHHDIYSIEDLSQLIFDLKNANNKADISVKLVSEVGVGTVAAGVAKARADHVTISGFEGGTGASPLTSIKHAGSPWEIGLAETHQTLVHHSLRSRIRVQVDGGLRTGRDVVIGALLGADEFGFSTAPLIAMGCVMMRKCHLNTCPVGIATQDKSLRKLFTGQPEQVIKYFFYVAEEVRGLMATMGFRTFNDMIGQSHQLDSEKAVQHWKARGLDLTRLLATPKPEKGETVYQSKVQNHPIDTVLDKKFIRQARPALRHKKPVRLKEKISNSDRTVGTMLSSEIARRYGHKGLAKNTIHVALEGSAGQSFGAFGAHGLTLVLHGDANDYVGKGLCGANIIIAPPKGSSRLPQDNIIVGNTVLYGAIAGACYFSGVAGERFAVRNSGAIAVVEGVGDHGCEYMTGGVVVVLGKTGRNFAAGMSGGIAYVLDASGDFSKRCNKDMVEISKVTRQKGTLKNPLDDMLGSDDARLRYLIEQHTRHTNSPQGAYILRHWNSMLSKFIKVTPNDFRRVLEHNAKIKNTAKTTNRAKIKKVKNAKDSMAVVA